MEYDATQVINAGIYGLGILAAIAIVIFAIGFAGSFIVVAYDNYKDRVVRKYCENILEQLSVLREHHPEVTNLEVKAATLVLEEVVSMINGNGQTPREVAEDLVYRYYKERNEKI